MIDRNTKIYMAYLMAHKKFSKNDDLLANFRASMHVSKQFKLPLLHVMEIVKSKRKSKNV